MQITISARSARRKWTLGRVIDYHRARA